MNKLWLAALSASLVAGSAQAQNAAEIDKVKAGHDCPKCNLFQADLTRLELEGKNFAHARLRQANLSIGVFNHSKFIGADLHFADLSAAVFSGANFQNADLGEASLVGADFEHANLRAAKLNGANLSGAELGLATGLTQRQLDQACGDDKTTLPKGLNIKLCK